MRAECSLSRMEATCMTGVGRNRNAVEELPLLPVNTTDNAERWYTVEQFETVSIFYHTSQKTRPLQRTA